MTEMKFVVFVFCLSFTLVCGKISLRQTNPGGHTPNYDNPKFILDERNAVIAIVTSTGCYLYHLTRAEEISAGDPGGLDSMEHVLMTELKSTKNFPVVASQEFHHLDHDIRQACNNDKTFDIHDVRT